MRGLLRPILVFYLRWLRAFAQIMAFFITIITDNFAGVAAVGAVFFLFTVVGVGGIDSSGQCGAFLGTTIFSILAIVLFLLFLSLFEGLSVLLRSWFFWFLGFKLRFFGFWVLHRLALSTNFGCYRPTTLETVLVGLASIKAGPEGGFGFSVKSLFDQFFKAIKLLALLFNLIFH